VAGNTGIRDSKVSRSLRPEISVTHYRDSLLLLDLADEGPVDLFAADGIDFFGL
jgi:hypothetical protein